jgi:hypothetical protein
MALTECSPTTTPAPISRGRTGGRPPALRSAVTNGSRMFVVGDSQSAWARRRRDLESLYADDLGGTSLLTAVQLGLVATAATMRVELEQLEGQLSTGASIDLDQYSRVADHYRRICETRGLERRARDITPNLQNYLAGKGRTSA